MGAHLVKLAAGKDNYKQCDSQKYKVCQRVTITFGWSLNTVRIIYDPNTVLSSSDKAIPHKQ